MSQASAQLEDLLGDALGTASADSGTSASAFSVNCSNTAYGVNTATLTDGSNTFDIYSWASILAEQASGSNYNLLSTQNGNSEYFLQLALAKNDKAGSGTGNGSAAGDPLGQGTSVLNGRWSTFVEVQDLSSGTLNGYARVPLYSSTLNSSGGGLVFANGTCDTAGNDQATCGGTWTLNTAGEWKNLEDISFPVSTGAWNSGNDIDYAVILLSDDAADSTSSGVGSCIPLIALPLTTAIQVSSTNTTVTFSAGDLKYTLA